MTYFVVTMEETLVEYLAKLFRDNVWKLHKLLKSIILDRRLQFTVELMKKLNKILDIEIKLLTVFHSKIDS